MNFVSEIEREEVIKTIRVLEAAKIERERSKAIRELSALDSCQSEFENLLRREFEKK
jgi:hypothetical protein